MTDHKIATLFPLMSETEIEELAGDIRQNGLKSPIITLDNQILDGRNRYRACQKAGTEPTFIEYSGTDPVRDVLSWNLHRRHLTPSQRATLAVEVLPFFEAEAEKRQIAALARSNEVRKLAAQGNYSEAWALCIATKDESVAECQKIDTRPKRAAAAAGAITGVNRLYVHRAKKLRDENPQIFEQVKAGEITLAEAKRKIARQAYEERVTYSKTLNGQTEQLRATEYDIVLADPPWQYDFSETDQRAIENHYDTMDVEEICRQAPPNLAKDCILFLWATAPKLLEALLVIERWGFNYRSHAVWDKKRAGLGYWFRGRHEILLVGTKGKPGAVPEAARVASIFEEARGEHSAKPEVVYAWIEKAFPMSCKLEMYSRRGRYGWRTLGNEVTEEAAA